MKTKISLKDCVLKYPAESFWCQKCGWIGYWDEIKSVWCTGCDRSVLLSDMLDDGSSYDCCSHCGKHNSFSEDYECPQCRESEPYCFGTIDTAPQDLADELRKKMKGEK